MNDDPVVINGVPAEKVGDRYVVRIPVRMAPMRVVVDPMLCTICGATWSRLDPPQHTTTCPVRT